MTLFRQYRFLLIVVVLAGLFGMQEVGQPLDEDDSQADVLVSELFPESAEAHFRRGSFEMSVNRDPLQARRSFEQALATGIKTNENLLYNYALILIFMQDDPKLVDAAIDEWRRNFPDSPQRDPKIVASEFHRQMPPKPNDDGSDY